MAITQKQFDQLQPGQRVRVTKSGKVYQVYARGHFKQWREDRQALYGALRRLDPKAIELIDAVGETPAPATFAQRALANIGAYVAAAKTPTTYRVEQEGSSHYVRGLAPEFAEPGETDTMLVYRYDAGDIDTRMRNGEMMHRALYDLYQCHEGLKAGVRFETEFGNFVCEGVHVVPEPAPKPAYCCVRGPFPFALAEGEMVNLLHALTVLRDDFSMQRRDASQANVQAQANRKVEELDALYAKLRSVAEQRGWVGSIDDESEEV